MKRNGKPKVEMDMNLVTLIERFGSDEKCRAYLEELRWPDGVKCPRCESKGVSVVRGRNQYDCNSCRYQFSVTSGTVFHDTHLPLWKWFIAVYSMIEAKKGISANQLKRMLGVAYRTSWYLCHRVRAAMKDSYPVPFFFGVIHCLMPRVVVCNPPVGGPFVRVVGFGLIRCVLLDEAMQVLTVISRDDLKDDLPAYRGIADRLRRLQTLSTAFVWTFPRTHSSSE